MNQLKRYANAIGDIYKSTLNSDKYIKENCRLMYLSIDEKSQLDQVENINWKDLYIFICDIDYPLSEMERILIRSLQNKIKPLVHIPNLDIVFNLRKYGSSYFRV